MRTLRDKLSADMKGMTAPTGIPDTVTTWRSELSTTSPNVGVKARPGQRDGATDKRCGAGLAEAALVTPSDAETVADR